MLYGLGLQDALEFLNGKDRPPTISGSNQIIDHILVSQNVLEHLVGAGQLVKNSTFIWDHPSWYYTAPNCGFLLHFVPMIKNSCKQLLKPTSSKIGNYAKSIGVAYT